MPITFSCPHCGMTTEVAEQYVGVSGPCKNCGKQITIPRPTTSGTVESRPDKESSAGCTIAMVIAGVLGGGVVLLAILAVLLLPAVQAARESARRMQCMNNMKQIALAMHNYHSAYGTFPPAYIPDADGQPMHSWRVLILPFLGQQHLYTQYDFDQPWDSANNQMVASQMPAVFACPSDPNLGGTTTSYVVVVGTETVFPGANAMSLGQISDGSSNTVMFVETTGGSVDWVEPTDIDIEELTLRLKGSTHPGGFHVGYADGSVNFVSDSMDVELLKAMTTAAGGEAVPTP